MTAKIVPFPVQQAPSSESLAITARDMFERCWERTLAQGPDEPSHRFTVTVDANHPSTSVEPPAPDRYVDVCWSSIFDYEHLEWGAGGVHARTWFGDDMEPMALTFPWEAIRRVQNADVDAVCAGGLAVWLVLNCLDGTTLNTLPDASELTRRQPEEADEPT